MNKIFYMACRSLKIWSNHPQPRKLQRDRKFNQALKAVPRVGQLGRDSGM